jgi:hypothetical protein
LTPSRRAVPGAATSNNATNGTRGVRDKRSRQLGDQIETAWFDAAAANGAVIGRKP